MELWLLWWDYAIYRYLEVWCQLGDVLPDVRFVRGDVKIQPAGPVPTQIISPFGGTFLHLLKKISILQLASSVISIYYIYSWINPEKVFGFSQSIQCSEFCFQHRSFLFTSIMIQSLGKLKGAAGEIITYWGFQYWIIKVMIIFQQTTKLNCRK